MKRPTSTFWICLTILVAGMIIGYATYQSNRYELSIYKDRVIDKYTGTQRNVK